MSFFSEKLAFFTQNLRVYRANALEKALVARPGIQQTSIGNIREAAESVSHLYYYRTMESALLPMTEERLKQWKASCSA